LIIIIFLPFIPKNKRNLSLFHLLILTNLILLMKLNLNLTSAIPYFDKIINYQSIIISFINFIYLIKYNLAIFITNIYLIIFIIKKFNTHCLIISIFNSIETINFIMIFKFTKIINLIKKHYFIRINHFSKIIYFVKIIFFMNLITTITIITIIIIPIIIIFTIIIITIIKIINFTNLIKIILFIYCYFIKIINLAINIKPIYLNLINSNLINFIDFIYQL